MNKIQWTNTKIAQAMIALLLPILYILVMIRLMGGE